MAAQNCGAAVFENQVKSGICCSGAAIYFACILRGYFRESRKVMLNEGVLDSRRLLFHVRSVRCNLMAVLRSVSGIFLLVVSFFRSMAFNMGTYEE